MKKDRRGRGDCTGQGIDRRRIEERTFDKKTKKLLVIIDLKNTKRSFIKAREFDYEVTVYFLYFTFYSVFSSSFIHIF